MWCAGLLLALGSLPLAATVGSVEERAVPPPLHGEQVDNATLNQHDRCEWERCEGRARVDQHAYPHRGSSNNESWRTPWEWCEEHAGIEQPVQVDEPKLKHRMSRSQEQWREPSPLSPPLPPPLSLPPSPSSSSPSTPPWSPARSSLTVPMPSRPPRPSLHLPAMASFSIAFTAAGRPFLFAVLLTVAVFAYGAARYADSDLGGSDGGECEEGDEMAEEPPAALEGLLDDDMEDTNETSPNEPISKRVAMATGAHKSNRMVDLDALAGHTTARALLRHARSATASISDGGGQAIVLPPKVHLAVRWDPGSQRVWYRLQHNLSSEDWILATCETFMLFIRRNACTALFEVLPDLGEFVSPACGNQEGRVVCKKRSRGAISPAVLLGALEKLAVDELDETLGSVVFVSFGDRLPLAGYALNEDGVSPMAPLGLSGARALDYFGQHLEPSTYLILADVAVRQPHNCNTAGDVVWPLLKKRARSDRTMRPAVVNLRADEIDQYDQYGKDSGWLKIKLSPNRRRELAADAIDAYAVGARSVIRESRLAGAGEFWTGPVRRTRTVSDNYSVASPLLASCRHTEWNKVAQPRQM